MSEHAGDLSVDLVVVDAESTDGTREFVERRFPQAQVLTVENRGFAAGNNAGLAATRAPFVLLLNPDTAIVEGSLRTLVDWLVQRPTVGLVGARQLSPDGRLQYTIRRFPSVARALGEALGSERWPVRSRWFGERELDDRQYGHEMRCDWTVGSFMLARREAIDASGFLDERFFLYCEEPDLCRRIEQAGWEVWHLPHLTLVHDGGDRGQTSQLAAQEALSRRLYMQKHFTLPRRIAGTGAVALGYAVRALVGRRGTDGGGRRGSALALMTVLGLASPPFVRTPRSAVATRDWQRSD